MQNGDMLIFFLRSFRKARFESESARYSIHLIMSITWSACGNGRKKNDKKKIIHVIIKRIGSGQWLNC